MFVPRAALLFLLVAIAGCDRGTDHAEVLSAPAAAATATATATVAAQHRRTPTEADPSRAPVAPVQGPAVEKPEPKPVAVARSPQPTSQRPATAPTGAAAPADEHAHHDHPADHVDPAPARADEGKGTSGETGAVYTCPMHPEVKSNAPGRCPECGMNLVQKKP